MATQHLALKKFDVKRILPTNVVVLIGKRNSGKTVLMEDILYHLRHTLPIGTVMSATEEVNPFYSRLMPSICIQNEYRTDIITRVMDRQKRTVQQMNSEIEASASKTSSINPHAFVILDDCLYDDRWTREKNIRFLFMNGRHLKILFMITMQYVLGIPPVLRANIDYVFIFREPSIQNRRRLYESYASMFPTFDAFCTVFDQCTEGFECMVICNAVRSNRLEDQVGWYKAEMHEPFKICSPAVWEKDEEQRRLGGVEENTFNPHALKKQTAPSIAVKKLY